MNLDHLDDHTLINTNVPISFTSWDGQSIAVTLTQISYHLEESETTCVIAFSVSPSTVLQFVTEQWFHLLPHAITSQVRFEPEEPIEVRALLSPALSKKLSDQKSDAETILAALLPMPVDGSESTLPSLAKAEYWFILDAMQTLKLPPTMQQSGSLRHGFRTFWIDVLSGKMDRPVASVTDADELNLAAHVAAFLHSQNLKFEQVSDQILRLRFSSDTQGSWTELIRIEPADGIIVLYSVFPEPIPSPLRQRIAMQLMNENYELLHGCFEMDQEDGELRFRSSMLRTEKWDESLFSMLLSDKLQVMKYYLPVVQQILQSS